MPIELPDINVLIALADSHHEVAESWFESVGAGWATCPFTESGFVRIVSNPAYASLAFTVPEAASTLRDIIARKPATHHFWSDDISLLDPGIFRTEAIRGPAQIADIYLLGLCQQHRGTLVTIDSRITLAAIVNPHADLIRPV